MYSKEDFARHLRWVAENPEQLDLLFAALSAAQIDAIRFSVGLLDAPVTYDALWNVLVGFGFPIKNDALVSQINDFLDRPEKKRDSMLTPGDWRRFLVAQLREKGIPIPLFDGEEAGD